MSAKIFSYSLDGKLSVLQKQRGIRPPVDSPQRFFHSPESAVTQVR